MEQKQRCEEREKWKQKEDGLQTKSTITVDWKWHEILRKIHNPEERIAKVACS